MFNFDLDKLEIFGIEFHCFCNLDCMFCPRNFMKEIPKGKIWIKEEFVDFIIENIIKKAKNLKVIGLSGLNQIIVTKDDVYYLQNFIRKCREINPNFQFKLCTNGATTKYIDYIDVFNLDCDIMHYTLHREQDFWVEDMIAELEKRGIKYNAYINKENNNIEMFEFNNKTVVFKPDYSKLYKADPKDYAKIIKENNYCIIDLNDKEIEGQFKTVCQHNQLRVDFMGNIVPCFYCHSMLGDNLEYGHLELIDGKVVFIENPNRETNRCDTCTITTDGTIDKNLDNYIKISR